MTDEEQKKADDDAKKKAESPSLIARAMKGLKDFNLFDTLHPQGTDSTKRGFTDIYPSK